MPAPAAPTPAAATVELTRLPAFKPDLYHRAWSSTPHPTLPLLATAHDKSVTVFSLATLSSHSALTGGHTRSVRCAAWKPGLPANRLCLVTASFDSTAGLWRWDGDASSSALAPSSKTEIDVSSSGGDGSDPDPDEWEFTLVLEGHENELKSACFSPSGQHLATCSRDKSVWIWEDVGASEGDDEWETVAVLTEHDGDVKCVAWCPDVPGRDRRGSPSPSADVLASASYDDTVRVWREDADGEWTCVAVLEGHATTVWGVQWEPRPRPGDRFPRLLSWSADKTLRVWSLVEEEDEGDGGAGENTAGGSGGDGGFRSGLGGIPNTMRGSVKEEWRCETVLPAVHSRDVYSAAWSKSGRIASTGSDGIIAVYEEVETTAVEDTPAPPAEAENTATAKPQNDPEWRILGKVSDGHGPYEINHVTWCTRFDPGTDRRGVEEMLVTTGDDGVVQPWQVRDLTIENP